MARKYATSAEKAKAWREANPDRYAQHKADTAARNKQNPARVRVYQARWREKNRERERLRHKAYLEQRPEVYAANAARRRAAKAKATPAWANEFFIAEAYALARLRTKTTGVRWTVDHVVPLRSKLVCGLHVETNLAVIPASENFAKGNRRWPDMP